MENIRVICGCCITIDEYVLNINYKMLVQLIIMYSADFALLLMNIRVFFFVNNLRYYNVVITICFLSK